jgi:hypothetical protein
MSELKLYNAVKDQMKTGDLLLWKTYGIVGGAIQHFTKSKYSHASLVLRLVEYEGTVEMRRFTTEATRHGVGINMLSRRLARQDGLCWWFPLIDSWDEKRKSIGEIALSYLNYPYDYKGVIRWLFQTVSVDGEALFCSELCYMAYGFKGNAPAPDDLLDLNIFKEGVPIL